MCQGCIDEQSQTHDIWFMYYIVRILSGRNVVYLWKMWVKNYNDVNSKINGHKFCPRFFLI